MTSQTRLYLVVAVRDGVHVSEPDAVLAEDEWHAAEDVRVQRKAAQRWPDEAVAADYWVMPFPTHIRLEPTP